MSLNPGLMPHWLYDADESPYLALLPFPYTHGGNAVLHRLVVFTTVPGIKLTLSSC